MQKNKKLPFIPAHTTQAGWDHIKKDKVYETELGDIYIVAATRTLKRDIMVFNTNKKNGMAPITLLGAEEYSGGELGDKNPPLLAYNTVHYEKSRDEKIETVKNGWKEEELVNNKKQFAKWRQENTSVAETSLNNGREDVMCQNNEMKMQGADVGLSLASYSEMENVSENLAESDKGGMTYDGADDVVGLSLEIPDETETGPESEARVGVTYDDAVGISLAEMENVGIIYDGHEGGVTYDGADAEAVRVVCLDSTDA